MGKRTVYYVKSSAVTGGGRGGGGDRSYEVRVRGWSCSCAASVFAAMKVGGGEEEEDDGGGWRGVDEGGEGEGGGWGGLAIEGSGAVCKHLLACVLAERWDVAGALVEEKEVGREEMAGWAAGWGG